MNNHRSTLLLLMLFYSTAVFVLPVTGFLTFHRHACGHSCGTVTTDTRIRKQPSLESSLAIGVVPSGTAYDSEEDYEKVAEQFDIERHDMKDKELREDLPHLIEEERIWLEEILAYDTFDENAVDSYEPDNPGGCIRNLENHIRLLNQSLQDSSGQSLFGWIQTQQYIDGENQLIEESAQALHNNTRFGVLSHGTQPDPVYNYGNLASLELFEQTIEKLCQTPSRFSTIPELMEDRSDLIKAIEEDGHGTIHSAIRISAEGHPFEIPQIKVWTVRDDDGKRIGLAAIYDRDKADYYKKGPLGFAGRYESVEELQQQKAKKSPKQKE